jgi:hypothetical protein
MTRSLALVLVAALGLAFAGFGGTGRAGDEQQPVTQARVVDRTLRCATIAKNGLREIQMEALAPVRGQTDFLYGTRTLASAQLSTGPPETYATQTGPRSGGALLAVVKGGAPESREARMLMFKTDICRPTATRVRLMTKGLSGGRADPFGVGHRCFPGKAILVRIRVVFRNPTSLLVHRRYRELWTNAPVTEGYIAVATTTGRPIALMSIREPRRARIFAAPGCIPD